MDPEGDLTPFVALLRAAEILHDSKGATFGLGRIEGDLTPFVPLLRAAEILHVGKGATFGLGRIAVEGRD